MMMKKKSNQKEYTKSIAVEQIVNEMNNDKKLCNLAVEMNMFTVNIFIFKYEEK